MRYSDIVQNDKDGAYVGPGGGKLLGKHLKMYFRGHENGNRAVRMLFKHFRLSVRLHDSAKIVELAKPIRMLLPKKKKKEKKVIPKIDPPREE